MIILFFWIGFSVAVGIAANTRNGRGGFGWFVVALIISPILAAAFLFALPKGDPAAPRRSFWRDTSAS
jgi:hypothetical protein